MSMIADPLEVDMEESMCTPDGVGLADPVNADIEESSSDGVGLRAYLVNVISEKLYEKCPA